MGLLQVFDKALTETTFCEIYAELCYQLNNRLPSFEPEVHDGRKRPTTFRCAAWPLPALMPEPCPVVLAWPHLLAHQTQFCSLCSQHACSCSSLTA